MRKLLFLVLSAFTLLTGCANIGDIMSGDTQAALKTGESVSYYNGYTGVEIIIPEGVYITEHNTANLTENAADSMELSAMDLYDYGDGGYMAELAGVQNRRTDSDDDHSAVSFYLEGYEDMTREEYYQYFIDYAAAATEDGTTYEIIENTTTQYKGRDFLKLVLAVDMPENEGTLYYEEYYVTPVGQPEDFLYFVAYANYWIDSQTSIDDAHKMLDECFNISGTTPAEG